VARSLYICYFGVLEPLVQTQVIPYLRELAKGGHEILLLTFEGQVTELQSYGVAELKRELADQGIDWYWLTYHKRFSALATAYDIFRGALFVRGMVRRKQLDILHGRVHVPTLMGALARKFSRRKPKLLFDIRGFFPEEYTDAGIWPEGGVLYRGAKRVERWLLKEADGFVVLTERAREILFPGAAASGSDALGRPVEVIPCCVDLSRFATVGDAARKETRGKLGINGRFVAAYVGAFGGWYLTRETADFFGELKAIKPDTFAMILTQSKPETIEPLLRERGYGAGDYLITKVPPAEIPVYLSGADVAVSFIKNCYSKQASSPTKNAEYLACGLPIIANVGVGDVDKLIDGNRVGALIEEFSPEGYRAAVEKVRVLGVDGERLRKVAENEFDLETVGGERYLGLYRRVLGND
jgi:glycosyltransferase involved in cell wall biosynthesis